MEARELLIRGALILALGLGLLLSGCSQFNPVDNDDQDKMDVRVPSALVSAETEQPPPFDLSHYDYPDAADCPPAGYQFIELGANNQGHDGNWVTEYFTVGNNNRLKLDNNKLKVNAGGMPCDSWVAMTQPVEDEPWVEYEPHGLVFTSPQYARISYRDCQLPEGIDPEDLEIWYWNEELGEYEYIGGYNNVGAEYIEFDIEHFSRYVVAGEE